MLRGHFLAVLGRDMAQGTEPLTFYAQHRHQPLGPAPPAPSSLLLVLSSRLHHRTIHPHP